MFDWPIPGAIGVVLLVALIWGMNQYGRRRSTCEFDQGMKRSAQTWRERKP